MTKESAVIIKTVKNKVNPVMYKLNSIASQLVKDKDVRGIEIVREISKLSSMLSEIEN